MDKTDILDKLFSLHRFGIKPGLERTFALLDEFGNPQSDFPAIHVAGTNGKGSVCSRLASILTESGLKTGLYTSPHILRFNERIRIDGRDIPDEDMTRLAAAMLPYSDSLECTFFEITTAMAFKYFSEQKVDVAVIETGMGGRFDSTNVLQPAISVITRIDYDHQEYLGYTIEEIASEKAGIIKPGIKTVIAPNIATVNDIFIDKARKTGSEIVFVEDNLKGNVLSFNKDLSMSVEISHGNDKPYELTDQLAGRHQLDNLLTALTVVDNLKEKFDISFDAVKSGLENIRKNTGLHGRIELLRQEPPLVIDVAHNPGGIELLFDTLRNCGYHDRNWNIVFGVMADKDADLMLSIIADNCIRLFAAVPAIERAMDLNTLSGKAKHAGINEVIPVGEVSQAVRLALDSNEPLIIAGSFYLVSEALSEITR